MKFLFQLRGEQLSHQACLFAGSVSFQPRSQSVGQRNVVYTLPMESNASKLLHSICGSRSERSFCVKSNTQLLHNLPIVGGQLKRRDLAFLQVEKHLLSSLWALHLLQLISSLNSVIACATCGPGRWGVSSSRVALGEWLFRCVGFVRAKGGSWLGLSKPVEELVRARKSAWLHLEVKEEKKVCQCQYVTWHL